MATTSTTGAATTTTRRLVTTTTAARSTTPPPVTDPPPVEGDQVQLTPGGIVFPYEAGRSVWEATSNGFTIRVRIEPAAPRVGEPVRFIPEATRPGRPCCSITVGYDGQMADQLPSADPACPATPGPVTAEPTFVYTTAGQYRFKILGDDCPGNEFFNRGWLTGWINVTDDAPQ